MSVEVRGLSKSYGEKQVLQNFSAVFKTGKTTCIMGNSGCGKTTLLRLLLGLETADAGEIVLPPKMKPSVVFQEDRLCNNLSAGANVRLVIPGRPKDGMIEKGFEMMGLSECIHRPARELSGGMRRRVALLRALLADWNVLFMDEPFKGLDEKTKADVIEYTKNLCRGKTVICVTHDANEAKLLGASEIMEMQGTYVM